MISRTPSLQPTPASGPRSSDLALPSEGAAPWQRSLAQAVRSTGELLDLLGLDPQMLEGAAPAQRDFPLRVPHSFVRRMRGGDPKDPLLLQVLPTSQELDANPGYSADPLGESDATAVPGLLHKYRGRALLMVTGACAIHCRYCFRRHFPYADHNSGGDTWDQALSYIAADSTLTEIILSGGDPLSVSDRKLARLASALASIPHLRRLRIHTRLPIALPERVDDNLLQWLTASRLQPVVVIHTNHPREIDRDVRLAIARLRDASIPVLNQTVLLAGINDDVPTLRELSETLFEAGVHPYYLHLMDRVDGAAHFEVDESFAQDLVWQLMSELPGYLVPKLVREVAGTPAKLPIPPLRSLDRVLE